VKGSNGKEDERNKHMEAAVKEQKKGRKRGEEGRNTIKKQGNKEKKEY
jgi:hypothetical protein